VPRQIQNSFPIDKPFDLVWQAVIETFAKLNLPILNMEKASGLITTDWISVKNQEDGTGYCDCGKKGPLFIEQEWRVKFNVFVKRIAGESSEMQVNAVFEELSIGLEGTIVGTSSCVSTGKFEKEIYDRVVAKAK
jgi:hypothetical protein